MYGSCDDYCALGEKRSISHWYGTDFCHRFFDVFGFVGGSALKTIVPCFSVFGIP